jgi:CubicO group peptidase (beta-lactamase class C family)
MRISGWSTALVLACALLCAPAHAAQAPAAAPATPATPSAEAGTAVDADVPTPADRLTRADLDTWLDGYLPYAIKSADIAGAVVVVVKDGQVLGMRGYGYADVASGRKVDAAHTLFRPGSISKLFTWTALMQLVEQGKIDLDADINTYLDFKIPPRDGKPITLRQVMQHVAGFEETLKYIMSYSADAPGYADALKRWVPERVFAAGDTPAYSNYGAALAGYVVERVSGEPFDDYIEKHLFAPLGMQHSTFRQPVPAALAGQLSQGYMLASDDAQKFEIVGPAPAGSLSATGQDMAAFMIAHLQQGEYRGARILQSATARQMHDSPLTLIPPLNRMQLGFFETNINGRAVIGHLGDTNFFHSALHLFLDEGVGLYISFNSTGKDRAAGGLRAALFEDFADRYFPAAAAAAKPGVDAATARQHAALMVGSWSMSRRSYSSFFAVTDLLGQVKVGLDKDGGLSFAAFPSLDGKPRRWVEVAPFVWQDQHSHDRLAAVVVDGKVVRWSFDMISSIIVLDRAPWYRDSAWLLPLFALSLLALLATAVLWPVRALVRRRLRVPLALSPRLLRAYRLSRIAAGVIVLAVLAWAVTLGAMMQDFNKLSDSSDGLIVFNQCLGLLAFVGGPLVMGGYLLASWRGGARWTGKAWSVVLLLASLVVLWVAAFFHLLGFGVNY